MHVLCTSCPLSSPLPFGLTRYTKHPLHRWNFPLTWNIFNEGRCFIDYIWYWQLAVNQLINERSGSPSKRRSWGHWTASGDWLVKRTCGLWATLNRWKMSCNIPIVATGLNLPSTFIWTALTRRRYVGLRHKICVLRHLCFWLLTQTFCPLSQYCVKGCLFILKYKNIISNRFCANERNISIFHWGFFHFACLWEIW